MKSDAGAQAGQGNPATARAALFAAALICSLPFVQPRHTLPLPGFHSEWLAFVLGLAALLLLAGRRAWAHGEFPLIACAPLALAALILLHAAWGRVPYAGQAVGATLYLAWAAALIALGAELRRRLGLRAVAAVLAAALAGGGVLTAFAGMLQHYGLEGPYAPLVWPSLAGNVYGNLAQRNQYADYLALALASCAYLYASGRMRGRIAVPVAAILVHGLAVSGSRAAWLYIALILGVAMYHRRRSTAADGARLRSFSAWVAAGFVADQLALALSGVHETAAARMLTAAGFDARLQILSSGLDMFLQSPLLGTGWGSYAWLDFERRASLAAPVAIGVTDNAHNVLLHLLAETGVCGALIAVAAAVLWWRDARAGGRHAEGCWLALLIGIIGVHSMLEFPLWQSYFLGVAALAAGLGATRSLSLPLARVAPFGLAAVLAAGAANAAAVAYEYRQLEQLFAVGRRDRLAQVDALVALAGRELLLQPVAELVIANRMDIDGDFLPEKLALNARVMRFFPAPMVVFRHAALLALSGDASGAAALFSRAARVYPGALPQARAALRRLREAYPAQIAPLLELASAKTPSPAVPAP